MKKIGFLINPIAGMGGAVGLKGTDGKLEEALSPRCSAQCKKTCRNHLKALENNQGLLFLTPSGEMGENALKETIPGRFRLSARWERTVLPRIRRSRHSGF